VGPISAAASASSLPSFTTAAISLISALVFIAAAAASSWFLSEYEMQNVQTLNTCSWTMSKESCRIGSH
jgi:hypothetical protein